MLHYDLQAFEYGCTGMDAQLLACSQLWDSVTVLIDKDAFKEQGTPYKVTVMS